MNVLLSIKPKYANAILSGEKLVEFRKLAFKRKIERVYIYSSAPEQKIIGYFTIEDIVSDTPKELWKKFSSVGSISQVDFFEYFANKSIGYSIKIKSVNRFKKSRDPKEIFENFVPPQSFMYCENI
ncbi:ASCH domain protein [soil metagenome]